MHAQASLTCCCHSSPDPADAARLPVVAPPPGTPSHSSLMDIDRQLPERSAATIDCDSQRHVDLGLLYRRLLI